MRCNKCGIELTALNMSGVDNDFCGNCAEIIINELAKDVPETTLVLWQGW